MEEFVLFPVEKKPVLNRGPWWLKPCYPGIPCIVYLGIQEKIKAILLYTTLCIQFSLWHLSPAKTKIIELVILSWYDTKELHCCMKCPQILKVKTLVLPVEFITNHFKEVFDPWNRGMYSTITDFRTIAGIFPVISTVDYLYFRGQKQYMYMLKRFLLVIGLYMTCNLQQCDLLKLSNKFLYKTK